MRYAVAIKRNEKVDSFRYIRWCDEHWYETSGIPLHNFTLDEAHTIVRQMRDHYSNVIEIMDETGFVVEHTNWLVRGGAEPTIYFTKDKEGSSVPVVTEVAEKPEPVARETTKKMGGKFGFLKLNSSSLMKKSARFIGK